MIPQRIAPTITATTEPQTAAKHTASHTVSKMAPSEYLLEDLMIIVRSTFLGGRIHALGDPCHGGAAAAGTFFLRSDDPLIARVRMID
jgi:hypothetical protein